MLELRPLRNKDEVALRHYVEAWYHNNEPIVPNNTDLANYTLLNIWLRN